MKIPWFLLNEIVWSSITCIVLGKIIRRSFIRTWMRETSELGMYVRSSEKRVILCQYTWMTSKWVKRSGTWLLCGRNWRKTWILTNPHHFLTACTWDAIRRNANRMKQSLNSTQRCLSHAFLLEQLKNYQVGEKSHAKTVARSYEQERHAQNALSHTANWQTKNGATLQSFASLFGWSTIQTGVTGIIWRIVRSLLANCREMLVLGKNWTTWHLVVRE